jgi:hypothetical protein
VVAGPTAGAGDAADIGTAARYRDGGGGHCDAARLRLLQRPLAPALCAARAAHRAPLLRAFGLTAGLPPPPPIMMIWVWPVPVPV